MSTRLSSSIWLLWLGLSFGCKPNGTSGETSGSNAATGSGAMRPCSTISASAGPLPQGRPEHQSLGFWLEQQGRRHDLDRPLLDVKQLETLNRAIKEPRADDYHGPIDLLEPIDPVALTRDVVERRRWAKDKLGKGEFVGASGARLEPGVLTSLDAEVPLANVHPELRVALADTQIHCAPLRTSFYTPALDLRLDRNACSMLRKKDVVRVLADFPGGMKLVQASYALGWIARDAALSPPIDASEAKRLLPASRALTRRAFLQEAWRYVGTPYGLGDTGGGRDCSRLVLDAFAAFGLQMPRHSAWQAQAGSFSFNVDGLAESERLLLFDAALDKGIVLLTFPGHVMIYLGRNEKNEPMVLHALGEYMESCAGADGKPSEALVRVKNIGVTTLELGRGTSRRGLLERVTRVTVIGENPGPELAGVAELRPAAPPRIPNDESCRDSEQAALYELPEQPNAEQPLQVVAALNADPGPARLILIDPDGQQVTPEVLALGGPPYGRVVRVEKPKRGRWKAVLADGDEVLACQRIRVVPRRPKPSEPDPGPIWKPRYRWNAANENLFSLFVERLFDHPLKDERTWTSLQPLLNDRERNLLFDYRGIAEDSRINFAPDCADLPYTLRAYFAWKLRLPFGYRTCTRGRLGKPPNCDPAGGADNLMSRLELPGKGGLLLPRDDVKAFELFINTQMSSGVHSSSGRTAPLDEIADLYPVPLTREALRPGTVFADPYGHLLVIADWIPQSATQSGILVGVDAQPDGTISQRRFWRGSFLFDPDTTSGGAGFKTFRPRQFVDEPVQVQLAVEREAPPTAIERVGFLKDIANKELSSSRRYVPLSLDQYKGSADDFYDSVEALINPRPLEPKTQLTTLVDALEEAVSRRVTSVNNAEKWHAEHPGALVEMPEGDSIFLSTGPWEDFSTPSRDLRLLIAIDTVLGFPARVQKAPERFGLSRSELEVKVAELTKLLSSKLRERCIRYTRSDGGTQALSLEEVVGRARNFEVAYNPNDCVEIRWGAPPDSPEMKSCKRRAPEAQRARMEQQYRPWFSTRKRPPK